MDMDVIILSFDDPSGLSRVLDLALHSHVKKIVIAYGNSNGFDYSYLDSVLDERVVLLRENQRLGKAKSLNRAMKLIRSDLVAMMSSDITFGSDLLDSVPSYFVNEKVGVLVPAVEPDCCRGIIGKAGALLWSLRNAMLQITDSQEGVVHGGEMLFLRRTVVRELPAVVNDEEFLCLTALKAGFSVKYMPNLLVHNHAPETFHDYLLQRSRVIFGHKQLFRSGFNPPVLDFMLPGRPLTLLRTLLSMFSNPKQILYFPLLAAIEICAVVCSGSYGKNGDPALWEFATSTKGQSPVVEPSTQK